ncbi:MAG: glycosyltransferase family 10 [Nostoc sp.]
MTYRDTDLSLKKDGRELDLINLRQKIALEGFETGTVDVYGRKWPQKIALGESRANDWSSSKMGILQKYHFNLCFENTNFDYYCTEKIWDSIRGRCLPIYYGKGNKIYQDFPINSFLDYSDFNNPKELFLYINKITVSEFRERINLCIEAYNTVYEKLQTYNFKKEMLLKIVNKIETISEN